MTVKEDRVQVSDMVLERVGTEDLGTYWGHTDGWVLKLAHLVAVVLLAGIVGEEVRAQTGTTGSGAIATERCLGAIEANMRKRHEQCVHADQENTGVNPLALSPEDLDVRIAVVAESQAINLGMTDEQFRAAGDDLYRSVVLFSAPSEASARRMGRIAIAQYAVAIDKRQPRAMIAQVVQAIRHRMCSEFDRIFREETGYPDMPVMDLFGKDIDWSLTRCLDAEGIEEADGIISRLRQM